MKHLTTILIFFTISTGCVKQLIEFQEPTTHEAGQAGDSVTELSVRICNTSQTKSSISADETAISDLNFFAYRNGKLEIDTYNITPSGFLVKLTRGYTYNLYAIANVGKVTAPVRESELSEYRYGINSTNDLSEVLPMAWEKESFTASQTEMNLDITLDRLVAKINFSIDKSALYGLQVTSIRLCQSAGSIAPFAVSGSSAVSGTDTVNGDYASATDIETVNSGGKVHFYTFENCQGTLLPGNTDPWSKVPDALGSQAELCTYMEVKCIFAEGFPLSGNVTYRFYIGSDNTTNFDIRRNSIMNISLFLTKNGLNEVSWKVEPDISVQDGYTSGWIEKGKHTLNNLYIGERFCYGVEVKPDLIGLLGNALEKCSLRFVSSGTASIVFSETEYKAGSSALYAYGTCTGQGTGEIWLCCPDGKQITPVSGTVNIKKPLLQMSFDPITAPDFPVYAIDEPTVCVINGEEVPIRIYLTDNMGYNLNTGHWCGYDLKLFDFEKEPYWKSDYMTDSNFSIRVADGISESDGPAAVYNLVCTNDGADPQANAGLSLAVRRRDAVKYNIDENNYGLHESCETDMDFQKITMTLVDNGWAHYHPCTSSLKIDNPSNMPLSINIWQVHTSNQHWNAISRNEILDYVRNELEATRTGYITDTHYDKDPVIYGSGIRIRSERNNDGDAYLEEDNLMIYPLTDISPNEIWKVQTYDKRGQNSLHHLFDVKLDKGIVYASEVELIDNLSNGSMEYDIIYGDDPEYGGGYNDMGIWLYSNDNLRNKPNTSLDGYDNLTANNISNLMSRYDINGPMDIKLTYDSSAGQLYATCIRGNIFNIKIDATTSVYAEGYVETHPNGTWFGGKDNYCSATASKTVTGITIGTGNVSIDGGAVKDCINKIYNQTFYDSHNAIGSSYNYQHSAHPTIVKVTLSLKVNGSDEMYPITVTWTNGTLDFYHAQDKKTYFPELWETCDYNEFIRVKKR